MLEKYLNKNSIIELVLKDDIPEENISSGIPFINNNKITVLDLYNFFQQLKNSSSGGIFVKLKKLNIGFARANELRSFLLELRKSGKIVYIYLEDIGNIEYFIATSADRIFIPPWATLNLLGLSFDSYFIKELLDSLDIEPEIDGFGEYKSAADMFNRKEMSSYHKEMMQSVLENHYNNLISVISSARNIPEKELKKIIDDNPLNPATAKSYNLIDEVVYENQVRDFIKNELDSSFKFVQYKKFIIKNKYSKILKEINRFLHGRKKYIGYININGMITQGSSKKGSGFVNTCGSDTVCELIKKATDDNSVKGVIVRVLSPGGSALASDLIRNEIENLNDKKPVVISMSDVAASGGYMVSVSSNKIHANPFTITGSIGVVAGKFNLKKLLNRYGIYNETLQKGKMASIYSTSKGFTKAEKIKFTELIKNMYDDFVKLVSEKRQLSIKDTENAAKGRVWTGEDAKKYGLVDELYSLSESINEIKNITGLNTDEEVYIKEFKSKNKLSFSNFGKLSHLGIINEYFELLDILKREQIYAVLPHSYKIH